MIGVAVVFVSTWLFNRHIEDGIPRFYRVIDSRWPTPTELPRNVARIQNETGYWGLIDNVTMEEILPQEYDMIWNVVDGYAHVRLDDGREVLINIVTREIVSDQSFRFWSFYSEYDLVIVFDEFSETGGIMELSTGEIVIPIGTYTGFFRGGSNRGTLDSRYQLNTIDSSGLFELSTREWVIPVGEFYRVESIGNDMALATTYEGLRGIIDVGTREELVPFNEELWVAVSHGNGLVSFTNRSNFGGGDGLVNVMTGETIIEHSTRYYFMRYSHGVITIPYNFNVWSGSESVGAFVADTGTELIPFGIFDSINVIFPERALVRKDSSEGVAIWDFVNQTYLIPFDNYNRLISLPVTSASFSESRFIAQDMGSSWYFLDLDDDIKISINGNFDDIIVFENDRVAVQENHRGELLWRFDDLENLISR